MTAPHSAAATRRARPTPSERSGANLRLVSRPVPRTPAQVRMALFLSTVVVFAVLLLAAVVHTSIVSGQRELDRVDRRIAEASRQNQGLRLRVAELESPPRVVEAATEEGLVVPEDVTWLSPDGARPAPPADDPPAPSALQGAEERAAPADGDAPGGTQRETQG